MAIVLMAERGIDIRPHRAIRVQEALLRRQTLIVVMECAQQDHIEKTWPMLHGRVYRWGHWQDSEVLDPFGRGEAAFLAEFASFERGLLDWRQRLEIEIARARMAGESVHRPD